MYTPSLSLTQRFLIAVIIFSCSCNPANSPDAALMPAPVDTVIGKPDIVKDTASEYSQDTSKQYIYLTFDDGPQPGTMQCVKAIKSMGVKASFFMIGMHAWDARLRHIVDTIRESYPQILLANHSYSHAFRDHYKTFYTHPYGALADFAKAQDTLNVPFKITRLPGNSAWVKNGTIHASKLVKPVCVLLDSAGYSVMGWDVEWNFKPEHGGARPVQSVSTMVKMINNTFNKKECYRKNNLVLLAHDRMFHTPAYTDSLYKFVMILKQNPHYVFETIDKYPIQKTD